MSDMSFVALQLQKASSPMIFKFGKSSLRYSTGVLNAYAPMDVIVFDDISIEEADD